MEFFEFADVQTTGENLFEAITFDSLPAFCASIHSFLADAAPDQGEMDCVWGKHHLHRDRINGGVRFSLDTCQNALAWTISTGFPPHPDKVVIHCTINRPEQDPDLVKTIQEFVANWKKGIEQNLIAGDGAAPAPMISLSQL